MDITDILGGLLKRNMERGGKGGSAMNDMFKRHRKQPKPSSEQLTQEEIDRCARELEEALNIDDAGPAPKRSIPSSRNERAASNQDRSLVLVRAMINAAKSDGRVDQDEQNSIIQHLGSASAENVRFLRQEFATPLDVREFARSVPVGMEEQVYTLSLMAIDLDQGSEAKYLMELAECLRLPPDTRERIHQRLGAPSMY